MTALYDLGGNGAALQAEIQNRLGATTNPAAGTVNKQLADIQQNTLDAEALLLEISGKTDPPLTTFTSATAAITATATAGNIVAAGTGNPIKQVWLYNSGANTVFIKIGGAATTTDYNFPLPAGMMVVIRQVAATVSISGVCAASLSSSIISTRIV